MPRIQLSRDEVEMAIRLYVFHNLGINLNEQKHDLSFRDTGGLIAYVDFVSIELK